MTVADEKYSAIAGISNPNKERYAARHGYHFYCARKLLDPSRSASWNKIDFLRHYLPDYDWVFWTDADSLIMNPAIKLEELIALAGEAHLILAEDEHGLNAGEFLLRNSPWSLAFLTEVHGQVQFLNHLWHEQAAISHVLGKTNSRVKYIPARLINAYRSNYREGDFLIHFPGTGKETIALMRQ